MLDTLPAPLPAAPVQRRQRAVTDHKRALILEAAHRVFERDGLEGANMRAIAHEAGYTAGALYNHYPNKEALYADLLSASLDRLNAAVQASCAPDTPAEHRVQAHAQAFFEFYLLAPRELDLGFYLFRGLRPRGLTPDWNRRLNRRLADALAGVEDGLRALGLEPDMARSETTALFGHCVGLLVLTHTGRIRNFAQDAGVLFARYVNQLLERSTP